MLVFIINPKYEVVVETAFESQHGLRYQMSPFEVFEVLFAERSSFSKV
tara:strand:- start:304 stop:447 length:144 start_codon:yes stop_codon:yes gene_type:complete